MWEQRADAIAIQPSETFALEWFDSRLQEVKISLTSLIQQFKLSEALKTLYSLIWDDFCSWYLEWVKPGFEQSIPQEVYDKTVSYYTELMQLLHPFMPFVTEEIYQQLASRTDDLCIKQNSTPTNADSTLLLKGQLLKEIITGLRDLRNKQQVKPKETIELFIQTENEAIYKSIEAILSKQLNTSSINFTNETIAGSFTTIIERDKFYIVTEKPIDSTNQKAELEKELNHLKGFLLSVEKKLSNEKFVQNAKAEVLAIEQKKKADAESKIKTINESLALLN
jgi:valyl-tRNA synthetase